MSEIPDRLRFLADWFDAKYHDAGINDEVQRDLRRFALEVERLTNENKRLIGADAYHRDTIGKMNAHVIEQEQEITRLQQECVAASDQILRLTNQLADARGEAASCRNEVADAFERGRKAGSETP